MKKFGDMLSRQGHRVMVRMGKAGDTKDPEYDAALAKCMSEGKKVKNIAASTEKLMSMLQANTVVLKQVIDEFSALVPGGCGPLQDLANAMEEVEAARALAEENLKRDMCIPVYRFYRQYKVMKKRSVVLDEHRMDMDRFRDNLEKITEKSTKTGNAAGIGDAENKYRAARECYEILLHEMMIDFNRLHDALGPFLQPAVGVFMREQGNYAQVYGRVMGDLVSRAGYIDTSLFDNYQDAITSEEDSTAGPAGVLPPKKGKKTTSQSKIAAFGMVAPGAPPPERPQLNFTVGAVPPANSNPTMAAGAGPSNPTMAAGAPPPGAAPGGRPRPPPPQRPPQRVERCRALYDFTAEDSTELPLRKGDVVNIIKKGQDWWEGECNGRRGLFPGNYVEMC